MAYTTSYALLETLWDAGVRYVFANFGSDHPAIMEAMVKGKEERKDKFPRFITCPNEMVALSMADGYARISGTPQCVLVHVDVGTQGLGAAVHNASCGRTPVFIFAGLSPITQEGELPGSRTEYIHWIQDMPDQKQIVSQYCRYSGELKTGKNVKQVVNRALQFASSSPQGPVYLVGSREVMEEEVSPYKINQKHWGPILPSALTEDAVEDIAAHLVSAKNPLVIVGQTGRQKHAVTELVALADTIPGLSVVDTGVSEMCFPADHPSFLGVSYGEHEAIRTADVILVADCDVPWIPKLCKPSSSAVIFHIDVDPLKQQMSLFYIPSQGTYRVDCGRAFRQLHQHIAGNKGFVRSLASPEYTSRRAALKSSHKRRIKSLTQQARPSPGINAPLKAEYLFSQLRKACPVDTIWCVEAVSLALAAADHIRPTLPFSWINSGAGGLGWSGGAALGIKLASDDQNGGKNKGKFICQIVGDGTFLFGVPSTVYWIARRYSIPVLTIVLNNKGWNAPRSSLLKVHPNGAGSKRTNEEMNISFAPTPDYVGIARAAAGGQLWTNRVGSVEELGKVLPEAVKAVSNGTGAVIEAQLDGREGKYADN